MYIPVTIAVKTQHKNIVEVVTSLVFPRMFSQSRPGEQEINTNR